MVKATLDQEVYIVKVADTPGGHSAPLSVRLRRWLKAGLRVYGIRTIQAERLAGDEPSNSGAAAPIQGDD